MGPIAPKVTANEIPMTIMYVGFAYAPTVLLKVFAISF
jgi:hypothetical protein